MEKSTVETKEFVVNYQLNNVGLHLNEVLNQVILFSETDFSQSQQSFLKDAELLKGFQPNLDCKKPRVKFCRFVSAIRWWINAHKKLKFNEKK